MNKNNKISSNINLVLNPIIENNKNDFNLNKSNLNHKLKNLLLIEPLGDNNHKNYLNIIKERPSDNTKSIKETNQEPLNKFALQSAKLLEFRIDDNYYSLKETNKQENNKYSNDPLNNSTSSASFYKRSPSKQNNNQNNIPQTLIDKQAMINVASQASASVTNYFGLLKDRVSSSIKDVIANAPNINNSNINNNQKK